MTTTGSKAGLAAALLILSLTVMPPPCLARLNPPDTSGGRDMQRTKQILQLLNDQAHRLSYMNTPLEVYSSDHKNHHRRRSRSSRKSKSSQQASRTSAVNQLLSGLSRSTRMAATRGFGDFTFSRAALVPSNDVSFTAPASLHVRKGVNTLTDTLVESSGALKSFSTSLVNVMGNLLDQQPDTAKLELALDKSAGATDSLAKESVVVEDQAESGAATDVGAVEDQDGGFAPISEENGFAPLVEDDTADVVSGNLDAPNKLVDEGTGEDP